MKRWFFFIAWLVAVRAEWSTGNHSIYYRGEEFRVRGINWFGFETECAVVHGLWVREVDHVLGFLRENQYNAIRIPFSYEMTLRMNEPISTQCILPANPWMEGMTIRQAMHMMFQKCRKLGIVIVIDLHTIEGIITTLPWTDHVSSQQIYRRWLEMIREFQVYPNLMAIDIKNEPHQVSWNTWGTYLRGVVQNIQRDMVDYHGLFMIEGISDHSVWGGSFQNMDPDTVAFFRSNPRVVFSPHVYGVSVRGSEANTDSNSVFQQWFGFLRLSFSNPILIGELGGFFITDDYDWHMKVRNYLIANDIRNIFYWCLNPDSIDTQGILKEDWFTPNQGKIDWHTVLQPNPTWLDFS